MQKNATQSTVMRVNNKRKHAHQARVFLTRVCAKIVQAFCVCVGRLSLTCTVGVEILLLLAYCCILDCFKKGQGFFCRGENGGIGNF